MNCSGSGEERSASEKFDRCESFKLGDFAEKVDFFESEFGERIIRIFETGDR